MHKNFINSSYSPLPLKQSFGFARPLFLLDADDGNGGDKKEDKEPNAEEKKAADDKAAQEKLNKQFAERATQAAESARKKLLEELGLKDTDEGKALLKTAKEAADAQKTAQQKAEEAQKAAETKAEKAEAEAQAKIDAANKRVLDSEIKINASASVMDKDGKKVIRPAFKKEALDDVLLLINREGIAEKDGKYENVEKALSELAKVKPWLLDDTTASTSHGNNTESQRRLRNGGKQEEREPIIKSL